MPIVAGEFDYLYRTSTGTYDNPMFKIGFHPLKPAAPTQKNYPRKSHEEQDEPSDAFDLGDVVKGKDLDGHTRVGVIIKIETDDEGDGTLLVIQDEKSNNMKRINPSTAYKVRNTSSANPETTPDNSKIGMDGVHRWSPMVNKAESSMLDGASYRLYKKYQECQESQKKLMRLDMVVFGSKS